MAFAAPQLRKLRARLNPRHVKSREAEGTDPSLRRGLACRCGSQPHLRLRGLGPGDRRQRLRVDEAAGKPLLRGLRGAGADHGPGG